MYECMSALSYLFDVSYNKLALSVRKLMFLANVQKAIKESCVLLVKKVYGNVQILLSALNAQILASPLISFF